VIPPYIHQTYSSRERLHDDFGENIKRLIDLNPGWRHEFYDDADIVKFIKSNYSGNVLRYFHQINPKYGPARADFFRYLLMFERGGVYLDIKSTITKPLEETLNKADEFLLSHWQNLPGQDYLGWGQHAGLDLGSAQGELQQWHIVCSPRHEFLKAVILGVMWNIDNYDATRDGVGKFAVLNTTGPIAYTRAIRPIMRNYPHRMVDIRADCGFEYSILEGSNAREAHEGFFKNHYGGETEPVILRDSRR
jgi:mannosyltransferase OCH1-like enzyme